MEVISVILNFVLASGLCGTLIFYQSKRRKEAAEATGVEIVNMQAEFGIHRQSVEFLSRQLAEAYAEIDKMQEIINRNREHILELIRQAKMLEMNLINEEGRRRQAEILACRSTGCPQRKEAGDEKGV